jgi:hypothetical protein
MPAAFATARMNRSMPRPGAKTTKAAASRFDSLRTVCSRPPGMATVSPGPATERVTDPALPVT